MPRGRGGAWANSGNCAKKAIHGTRRVVPGLRSPQVISVRSGNPAATLAAMALKPLAPLLRGYHVVLASASPRRREILDLAADPETQHLIIGADTIVAMEGQIMGKPCDREDALRMLTRLNGREHSVITGVAIILTGGAGTRDTEVVVVFHEETLVTFSKLSDELVQEHVEGGEPWDKAGGYGLQARGGAIMAEAVQGDPLNAAGLPLNRLCRELGRRLLPSGPGQEVKSQT